MSDEDCLIVTRNEEGGLQTHDGTPLDPMPFDVARRFLLKQDAIAEELKPEFPEAKAREFFLVRIPQEPLSPEEIGALFEVTGG